MRIILGLGCNIGDRVAMLQQAAELLIQKAIISIDAQSSLYESEAVLLPDSPPSWNLPFLNMAVSGDTAHGPEQLLTAVKECEQALGRQDRGKWSPREIDIDILAYGEEVVTIPSLTIPHPYLRERNFALLPFAELWPEWRFPGPGPHYGKTASMLAAEVGSDTITIRDRLK